MTDTLDTLDLPRIDRVAAAATHARYHIEPLPGGYGTTLGAALRRVLLSALPGAAIVALRVDGLLPGATALPGVREDLAELLLALRRVRLRYDGAGPVDLTLDISAPGEVTAGLLVAPPDAGVEIVTPAAYLLTLDPGAELHATLTVARGTGYATAPPHDNDTPAPVAALPVDALFSPIRRVSYTVERARVGPLTTYDRLVLDIETDGILTPDQALHLAAARLVDHFARVATATGAGGPLPAAALAPLRSSWADAATPLDTLGLSTRAYNGLRRAGLLTVGDALALSTDDLLTVRAFGRTSALELRDALVRAGVLTDSQAAARFADLRGGAAEV